MAIEDFPPKLELMLKALSLSRGGLAAELGVDKSVISRWLNRGQAPSGHNLARLTALVAQRRPGFTMLDWETDLLRLSARLGVEGASTPSGPSGWLPDRVEQEARAMTALRGDAYEGFWRTVRPSNEVAGRFVEDQVLIRREANGFLGFRLGLNDIRFEGWTFPTQTQLFSMGADERTGVFIFTIFNAVLRDRADVMDGITLTCQRSAGGAPVAAACLMERTGFLTGDRAADDARYEAAIRPGAFVPDDQISEAVRKRLFHDVGPSALAAGGEALLVMAFAKSLSRGPLTDTHASRGETE